MNCILSIAIGPVQDFIAAARRTRDLWFGSQLLSEVSKAAARRLAANGAKLIFPAMQHTDSERAWAQLIVANKLLAIAPLEGIRKLAGDAKEAAEERLRDAATSAKQEARQWIEIDETLFDPQMKHILEFYVAWTPLEDGKYKLAREHVELLAAARKTTRLFAPHEGRAGLLKSSLDGTREEVLLHETRKAGLWESKLGSEERLDAIGVVKRFAGGRVPFESTIDVAALPFQRRCEKRDAPRFAGYMKFSRKFVGYESCSLLYQHQSRQPQEIDQEDVARLRAFREYFPKPSPPYYALLVGDGDKMGAAIGSMNDPEAHRKFSRQLSGFAATAHRLVEDHQGCPVYTGGDDVLALVPLHTALDCMQAVNEAFAESMADCNVETPTFSAGLVVAHAMEPLSEVRLVAQKAERAAKDPKKGDRNALAITVVPRSGADVTAFGKWAVFLGRLKQIVEMYREKTLSPSLAYEFRELERRTPKELDDLIVKMALAVAARKENREAAERLLDTVNDRPGFVDLYRTMLVARPFYRAAREAADQ